MKKNVKVLQIIHDLEPPFELVAKSYAESFFGCCVTTIVLRGKRDENFFKFKIDSLLSKKG